MRPERHGCTLAFKFRLTFVRCGVCVLLYDNESGKGDQPRPASAWRGEVHKGLFVRGADELPLGERIATVRALIGRLLTPGVASGAA